METIAFKSSWKHAVLEYQIKEIDTNQDLSRSAITNRAIDAARNVEDWGKVKDDLALLKRMDISIATSMQAKPDEERAEKVREIRKKMILDLKNVIPDLKRLQTPYFMQLLWMNYLNELKKRKMAVGKTISDSVDLSGPDMVKRLVQILLLNREADKEVIEKVKNALLEWEE